MSVLEHVDGLLVEHVLDTLSPEERAAADAHLAGCPRCAAELARTAELLADLALDAAPIAPPPSLRGRILDDARGTNRFLDFLDRVAEFLDVPLDRARAYLARVDDPASWQPLPIPGYSFFPVEYGPRLGTSQVGFLRIEPGARFPYHRHTGDEEVMILQGGIIDDQSGREWHPGEIQPMAKGTAHSYVGAPGAPCICIGRVLGGEFEIIPPPNS